MKITNFKNIHGYSTETIQKEQVFLPWGRWNSQYNGLVLSPAPLKRTEPLLIPKPPTVFAATR